MIALDTNILVRFMVIDDEAQFKKVNALFQKLKDNKKQAFIPSLVILETIWVLSMHYKVPRADVIENVLKLLKLPILNIEHDEKLTGLLVFAKNTTFDLSDLMIAYRCQIENSLPVMTFDKKASTFEMFHKL